MSAQLLIRDGAPLWWTSTDLWVVPGSDPNGPPGSPVAGQPAYLWAHVANLGNAPAYGSRVDFYWANPAAQVAVGVATPIGSAYADLLPEPAGQDVLCLVPWLPVIVNGGHECLLAVVHGPGDSNPLPDPLPHGYLFDPPAHEQIAQANLTVLAAAKLAQARSIAVYAPAREAKRVRLTVEYGAALGERQLELLGLRERKLRPAPMPCVAVRLSLEPLCGGDAAGGHGHNLEVELGRGGAALVYVALDAARLEPGHYQLVHIVEYCGSRVLGGVSYVVVQAHQES